MRLQLALNVPNLEAAIGFYEQLFSTPVAKIEPGYANFEVAEPPLKLVLFESSSEDRLNHLGVEVFSEQEVKQAGHAWLAEGLEVEWQQETQCCYAEQNKAVTYSPDGTMWEVYQKLSDSDVLSMPDTKPTTDPAPVEPQRCC